VTSRTEPGIRHPGAGRKRHSKKRSKRESGEKKRTRPGEPSRAEGSCTARRSEPPADGAPSETKRKDSTRKKEIEIRAAQGWTKKKKSYGGKLLVRMAARRRIKEGYSGGGAEDNQVDKTQKSAREHLARQGEIDALESHQDSETWERPGGRGSKRKPSGGSGCDGAPPKKDSLFLFRLAGLKCSRGA